MLKEFKQFFFQNNVVSLAVAVVMGAAFGTLVQALVANIITPLITIPGKVSFASLSFRIGHSVFHYGVVINALVSLIIVAVVVYFAIFKPLGKLQDRINPATISTFQCPECLSAIPLGARRCAYCTAELAPKADPLQDATP